MDRVCARNDEAIGEARTPRWIEMKGVGEYVFDNHKETIVAFQFPADAVHANNYSFTAKLKPLMTVE